jgi:hypothetical protein
MRLLWEPTSYDELADESFSTDPVFFQLSLPAAESGELLRLLAMLNIDASTLFPGFNGAAQSVQEMMRWPDQDEWRRSERPGHYGSRHREFLKRHRLFGH